VTVTLVSGGLRATFAPEVGMVGCSLRHEGEEVLGQRGGLDAYAARGSSFGIPLLHPWANRLDGFVYEAAGRRVVLDADRSPIRPDENGLPIHGVLAASRHWEVISSDSDSLSARLDFGAHEELLAAFPFPHELRLDVRLGETALTIDTVLAATGDAAVPVSFGWHPYFTLPGVPRADWQVEMPARRRAQLDERGIPTGESSPWTFEPGPLGDRVFDDLFPELADPARFGLAAGGRRMEVEFGDGYPYAQVYAPEGSDFICFEPMTAPTNALVSGDGLTTVEPGERYTARFSVQVFET
jgi:galactose mutarotase-like enzyme